MSEQHRHILPIQFGKAYFWYSYSHRHYDTTKVPDGVGHQHPNNGGRAAIYDVDSPRLP